MTDAKLDNAIAARIAAAEALARANRAFIAAIKEEDAIAIAERKKVDITVAAVKRASKMLRQAQSAEVEARRSA